jgi:hypothetical protein
MFKKLIEFLRKIGVIRSHSSTWKGKGVGDYNTGEYQNKKKEGKE